MATAYAFVELSLEQWPPRVSGVIVTSDRAPTPPYKVRHALLFQKDGRTFEEARAHVFRWLRTPIYAWTNGLVRP